MVGSPYRKALSKAGRKMSHSKNGTWASSQARFKKCRQKMPPKTGLKNWRWEPARACWEPTRALRIERKMPESQSRLDPNPGFG
ncbi:MAG: hypothetical protein DWI26_06230 [Planctomycetota bacterium]|nr:MAG: hypothetical protein DWI26_06230 [Planctomycetota bacterium]